MMKLLPRQRNRTVKKKNGDLRTNEALATGADIISTACPFCMIMLDDAVKANGKGDEVSVVDISQMIEKSIG